MTVVAAPRLEQEAQCVASCQWSLPLEACSSKGTFIFCGEFFASDITLTTYSSEEAYRLNCAP